MLKDLRLFQRNSGKHLLEGNENLPATEPDSSLLVSDPGRPPLCSIPEPTQKPKSGVEQDLGFRSKIEGTPSRNKGKNSDARAIYRTPEKPVADSPAPPLSLRNRFGWGQKSELNFNGSETSDEVGQGTDHFPPRAACPGNGGFLISPRLVRTAGTGRTTSSQSESCSTQNTPSKSVTKPPNPAFLHSNGSRNPLISGARGGNYSLMSRGISSSSVPSTVVNTVEVPYFELREDPLFWMDHNVQVLIRIRPPNCTERSMHGYNRCLKQDSAQTITWIGQPETRFKFDHVACETVNQEKLFRVAGLPMVQNCMSGYNSCMFAYGQTGSGKTYTMLGEIDELDVLPSLDRGMTPRIFEFLFAKIREEEENRRDEKLKYNCKCSFLEIYNEQITDLLDPSSSNLLLREDVRKGVYVENLTESEVESVNDILKLLMQGAANRKVAATNMNRESSRSHSVFTCVIESRWENDSTTNLRYGRLNLVDLAGSERQKASGAEGERLKEAASINKSLSALGHVIMVLVDLAQGKQRHVPYRDSRLTFLLQDSLGGNSKTMIIANVSPSISCAAETLSTLKFAQRAKLIQNNAVVNENASGDIIALQHQIHLLKEELSLLKHSRSLSFRSPMVDDYNTERSDAVPEEKKPSMDCVNIDDSQRCQSFDFVRVSTKQLKSLETILTGALRREQMADIAITQLQAEIEQLNRLVRQREDETRCTKMMLRFRDEKIRRMESLVDGLLPADSYLIEQNSSLAEEIHLLQTRVDRNPEITRFATENVRLLDQLRRFQDFFEEGEREILLSEISELRDQLYKFLDGNSELSKLPRCMDTVAQENSQFGFARTNKEKDPLYIELKKTCEELDDCRRNLTTCLEINAKLTGDIDHLNSQLNSLKSAYHSQDANIELQKDLHSASSFKQSQKDAAAWKHELTNKHAEEIMKLQLELDIVRIIHYEEMSCRCQVEQRASQLSKDLEVVKDELMGAKSIIEALESQQILSISELEELRDINNQYAELHGRRDPTLKASVNEDSPLQAKLKRMQASLEKARLLNTRYQGDQASQISHEQEMDEIRSEVEAETAEVIVCLQEELSSLQQQVDESSKQELETKKENIQLCKLLEERDEECKMLTEEWDKLVSEVSEVLADGDVALEEVSDQVEIIVDSFQQRTWVGEQVGRMVRIISEKELLIEELQKGMEDAYKIRGDLEWKLRSLRGATLAITEAQQQENCEKEKEVLQLTSKLSEQKSLVDELESKIKQREDQIRSAEVRATVAFMMINRLSEINSVRLKEMKKKEAQQIQAFKLKLEQSEEDQERVRIMESRFSDDILKTKERLDEFKMRLSTLSSCMSDYTENVEVSNLEKDEFNCDEGNYGGLIMSERVQYISRNDSEMISENATERDSTILLLRKEIESALDSLSAVQTQVTNLLGEKEEFKKSERQNSKNIEHLRDQVLKMQIDMSDLQRQFQLGALELAQKLQTVQDMAEKARVVLEVQLNEAKAGELQKTAEAFNLLTKFEEAQATMQEADVMINALVTANEAAKHEIERHKEIETSVRKERDQLINEVQSLRSSNNLKDQQYEDLAAQFHSNLAETGSLVQAFDDILKQVEITFKEESESILCDIQNLKSQLLHSMNLAKTWLEDIWSEIIVKDCAMSVLHLCHIGVLLEMLTGLNAEKGLLHHGLTESNLVIADLREHNFRAKKELQMCSVLKGKLLIDIRNSFQQIARKEEEADKLSAKINLFEKKILDVQMQEESMLAFSNCMELELVDIRLSNSVTDANLETKKQEQALLVGKLHAAEEDNVKLKIELGNLKAENSRVYEDLQGKRAEFESYSSQSLERLSSLEACITYLSNDLETKKSKLEEAKYSHLVIAKENESLVSELMLSKQKNDEMLTSLKLNARRCCDTVQAVDSFGKKMFQVIMNEDNKDIMLLDKMFQEICYYEEIAQKFIAESYLLEKSVKGIISEKLYLQSESEQKSSHLLERFSSLEACITCLSSDLETKSSKLEEAKHSHFVIAKENESLVSELMLSKQKNDELLTSLKLNARRCYDIVQAVDSFGKKMLQVIKNEDDKDIMLLDKMFQEICYYEESAQKFLAESQLLEKSVKEIISEKLYLQSELERKEEIMKGLSFDLSLLQESASNVMDQKDEFEELLGTLESLEEDLAIRSNELDEALAHGQILEAQLHEKMNTISTLELDLAKAQEWLQLVSGENLDLKAQMEDLLLIKNSTEEQLTEKSKMTERLEEQVQEMGASLGQMDDFLESMKRDLIKVTNDKDCLESEVLVLKEQLEMAQGLAEENEAIATEAQQMAEASKAYAVDKEEEAKLLEKSVEELECTINILENKVEVVKGEAQRQRLQREELEIELQAVKHQMLTVHASNDLSRTSGEKNKDIYEAQRKIQILELDLEEKEAEMIKCKRHISELNMHAESQAREYMQKFKALEAMAQQVKPEPNASYNVASSTTKPEKNAAKSRGSGSPFKCIGLGLAQQVNSEKDEELTAGRLRIEELEALASSRQKEIFMLNTRLAAAESMTHDVIRDLLGVKLDMSNYASLLDHEEVQKIAEKARLHSDESLEKEVVKLKQQLTEFIEERQGWLDEINRKHSEMVAARVAVEKLRREDQFLTTENEKLKLENASYHKKVMELEGELKKLSGQQNLQQRIHHHAKIKEENNSLRVQNEDLSVKLRRSELTLSRVKEELARYRASSGKIPYVDIDEEQRLKNQLKDMDEERVQLAQQLLGLCTSILKAAGITDLVADICPSMAEEALNQLKDRVASSERELHDLKYKNKISSEKMRLSGLRQQSPPLSTRTTENCSTPKRLSQAPLSPLSR